MAGYLGAIPVPQATQHRESFTATSGQTTFNTAGYTAGFLDVYLNGSHLSPADFTATNGSDVVLASGASTGDVCDIISYTAFEVANQTFTGTTTMDVAAITGSLNVDGTVTADGLTVDGDLSVSAANSRIRLFETDTTDLNTQLQNQAGDFNISRLDDDAGGSTVQLTIDHATGNVGIGTSAPLRSLQIGNHSGAQQALSIQASTTGKSDIFLGDGTGSGEYAGLIRYDHASDFMAFWSSSTERMRIDATGAVTMPAQPAFQANPASEQSNVPINATQTVVFGTEIFDQNADFASNTFTAPVTGKYQFNTHLRIDNWDVSANYYQLYIITSNRNYISTWDAALHASTDQDYITLTLSTLADMDASDTARVGILQSAGAAQSDISPQSTFSGYLVA